MRNGLLFIFTALLLLLILPRPLHAQKEASVSANQTQQKEEVNYFLAYPGILPDSPFYFLKVIRDKIVSFLINDPLKKSQFNLLTSDKRVFAGQLLIERGKDELGVESISKGNNYYHSAVSNLVGKKGADGGFQNHIENLRLAAKKHIEVISNLKNEVDSKYMKGLDSELKRAEDLVDFVDSVFPQEN